MKTSVLIIASAVVAFACGAFFRELISSAHAATRIISVQNTHDLRERCDFNKSIIAWGNEVFCVPN